MLSIAYVLACADHEIVLLVCLHVVVSQVVHDISLLIAAQAEGLCGVPINVH
jgi:hypothetical protein